MTKRVATLPAAPLVALIEQRAIDAWTDQHPTNKAYHRLGATKWASQMGLISERVFLRWKEPDARLYASTGDRVAIALGVHPSFVWPVEWWEVRFPDESRKDAA